MALVDSLPTEATTKRLPPRQRVAEFKSVLAQLEHRAQYEIDDARTLVHVARAEPAA